MKEERLGVNDKMRYNQTLVANISSAESKVMKRKQLYRKQLKKHDKVMNRLRKDQRVGGYQLSDDSSDMDECLEDNEAGRLKIFEGRQEEEMEELKEEVEFLKHKQKTATMEPPQDFER